MRLCGASLLLIALAACGPAPDDDTLSLYPLDDQYAQLNHPRDAIRRFERDYRVKPGTGEYRIFALMGLVSDCFMVVPTQGTEMGVRVVHASREDGDAIYCYDAESGQFTQRL